MVVAAAAAGAPAVDHLSNQKLDGVCVCVCLSCSCGAVLIGLSTRRLCAARSSSLLSALSPNAMRPSWRRVPLERHQNDDVIKRQRQRDRDVVALEPTRCAFVT